MLLWVGAHEPDVLHRARWALQPKDWVRMRFTGLAATDPTDASGTLLFDLARGVWADGVIAALGLPAGPASELGLTPGIPVAVGAADTAAALYAADLGEGDGRAGWALLTVGTGGQWMVPEGEFRPAAGTNVFAAVGGGFYRLAPVQNAGEALDWVRGVLGVSWQQLYDTAWRPWRPDTPVFLPYLARARPATSRKPCSSAAAARPIPRGGSCSPTCSRCRCTPGTRAGSARPAPRGSPPPRREWRGPERAGDVPDTGIPRRSYRESETWRALATTVLPTN